MSVTRNHIETLFGDRQSPRGQIQRSLDSYITQSQNILAISRPVNLPDMLHGALKCPYQLVYTEKSASVAEYTLGPEGLARGASVNKQNPTSKMVMGQEAYPLLSRPCCRYKTPIMPDNLDAEQEWEGLGGTTGFEDLFVQKVPLGKVPSDKLELGFVGAIGALSFDADADGIFSEGKEATVVNTESW